MTLKLLRAALLILSLAALPQKSWGKKLDIVLGGFQIKATNDRNNTSNSISGFGSYHLGYRQSLIWGLEADIGYSVVATQVIVGDLSYGLDIGLNYFPLTPTASIEEQNAGSSAIFNNKWRPFIGGSFHQRNFQSTSAQYAGPGIRLGTEYHIKDSYFATGMFRYLLLGGPNQSTATQIEMLFGIMYQF